MRALIDVRREQLLAVEIPFALDARPAVGMAGTDAQEGIVGQAHAEVRTLQRIRVIVVDALPFGVELVGECVVVEASARAGE